VPRALARDHESADVSEQDRAMLDYAAKLTRSPHAVGEPDVQRLRDVGFDETGILDICQVVAYYNYVNRLADGLGVELEEFWRDEDLTMTREEFDEMMEVMAPEDEGGRGR
jgi:uncharacterized peroxidase-related enzyme